MKEHANQGPSILSVERLELSFIPQPWIFAESRREEIAAYFADLQRRKPAIWNGRVLLLHHYQITDGVFRGAYLETDFASFCAWRDWGRPPTGVNDCAGAAAIVSADGDVLLGVMAPHTFNAGQIYFPCGTPDLSDIVGDRVDLDFSVRRELGEETSLDPATFDIQPGWTTVIDGPLIMQIKTLRSREDAETLRARICAHLAREQEPELSDVRIVRGSDDYDAAMPRFVRTYLDRHFDETRRSGYQTPGTRR